MVLPKSPARVLERASTPTSVGSAVVVAHDSPVTLEDLLDPSLPMQEPLQAKMLLPLILRRPCGP